MKGETPEQKAADAIETIIRAAKILVKAEKEYYKKKARKARSKR